MSVLGQTAAVVEGTVSKIDFTYTDAEGPWTVVTLSNVMTHLGKAPSEITIRVVGGPKPNGKWLMVSDHPQFVLNERYVILLRNTRWHISPVINNLALRVADLDGSEVLVDSNGSLVTGVDSNGVQLSGPVFERPMLNGEQVPPVAAQGRDVAARMNTKQDRKKFIAALRGAADARRLSVAGQFYDLPVEGDDWRATPVAAPASP